MNPSDRRSVSLAGLSLIGAGAVLGLALSAPASPASASADGARPVRTETSATVDRDHPDH